MKGTALRATQCSSARAEVSNLEVDIEEGRQKKDQRAEVQEKDLGRDQTKGGSRFCWPLLSFPNLTPQLPHDPKRQFTKYNDLVPTCLGSVLTLWHIGTL